VELRIRAEHPGDERPIHDLLVGAFPADQEALLVSRLRENGSLTAAFVGIAQERVIGYIAFSPVTIDAQAVTVKGAGLAPLAVHPEFQRRGIGARLVRAGIAACEQSASAFVVVLGEPGYYARFGFRKASLFGVDNIYGVDAPFMILELQPGAVKPGLANYGPEFAALST
jgi:putative acetyltransferase